LAQILGVVATRLQRHADTRGVFTEIFRSMWDETEIAPVQWNLVTTRANVLRGVHIHVSHADYLLCTGGAMRVLMKDVRRGSPTHGVVQDLTLRADNPAGLTIPIGVAHGFYSREPSQHLYAMSEYWNVATELGCRWNDPDLGYDWGADAPIVSARDAAAGSYAAMVADYEAAVGRAG
jgi:dTDP-4-dehydrorhamnose 3,5-epimerase